MTEEKLDSIIAKQVPDHVKREKADFIVYTDRMGTFSQARAQTSLALHSIFEKHTDKFKNWTRKINPPKDEGMYL